MKRILTVCFSALIIPALASADEQAAQVVRETLRARMDGANYLALLLGTFITLFTAIASITGYFVYRKIVGSIESEMRNKILENEVRSMIRLGLRDYENYMSNNRSREVAFSSLASAITHTRQAFFLAEQMSKPITYAPKNDLLALAGANLGYYEVELMNLIKDDPEETKQDRENAADRREKYRKLALEHVEAVAGNIEACERRGERVNCQWWDPVESRLKVLYSCSEPDLSPETWEALKGSIYRKLMELRNNLSIPHTWKEALREDWKELIQEQERLRRSGNHAPKGASLEQT